jgi:hypothetical protein
MAPTISAITTLEGIPSVNSREFAAVGRLLQRHTGPIFHLIEDLFGQSIVEVHQEIAAALISPGAGWRPEGQGRHHRAGSTTHLQARYRKDRAGRDKYASRISISSLDDDATREGMIPLNLLVARKSAGIS